MEKDPKKTTSPVQKPEYPEDTQEDYFADAIARGIKKAEKPSDEKSPS